MKYANSFGYGTSNKTMSYMFIHRDQLVIEAILNYINSKELTDNNSKINNENYDYKGLNELYKETLECLKFNLIAVKENVSDKEVISGLSLQKKKINNI